MKKHYFFLLLLSALFIGCNPDEPEEDDPTPTPTPAPAITAASASRYSITVETTAETAMEDTATSWLNGHGLEDFYNLSGSHYNYFSSWLTSNGNDLNSDTNYGMKVCIGKVNYGSELTDTQFLHLFEEGEYPMPYSPTQGNWFAIYYYGPDGSEFNSDDPLQDADARFEILDAIPEVVDGVQTVKVYARFDCDLLNLDSPGPNTADVSNAIFIGTFANEY